MNRINAKQNIVNRVAGTFLVAGYSGDGGPATLATLNIPVAVALESIGNIYNSDSANNVIRKIDPSGVISTFVGSMTPCSSNNISLGNTCNGDYYGDGGPAKAAAINTPKGIKLDLTERFLYICDSGNNVVRRVDMITSIITTIAGNGTAGFSGDGGLATEAMLNVPRGIALSPSGDILVADSLNHVIRKISIDHTISTVAGVPTQPGGSGNGGLAISARLNVPFDVEVDSKSQIYIADSLNSCVRKVLTDGTIIELTSMYKLSNTESSPLASLFHLQWPFSLAFNSKGDAFISDNSLNGIFKVDQGSGSINRIAGSLMEVGYAGDSGLALNATINTPAWIITDAKDNVFFIDSGNYVVRKISASSGIITTVAGTGHPGFNALEGPAISTQLQSPYGIALDSVGDLFISDYGNSLLRKVSLSDGSDLMTTMAGARGSASFSFVSLPGCLAFDVEDNLFFVNSGSNQVKVMLRSNGTIKTVAGNGTYGYTGESILAIHSSLSPSGGIAVDKTGNVYIATPGRLVAAYWLALDPSCFNSRYS